MEILKLLKQLNLLFHSEGESIYAVGGSVRDYLRNVATTDFDFATSATPDVMKKLLPDANFTFARFGTVSYKFDENHIEITTFRHEDSYRDARHPSQITFVKEMTIDAFRRDFTINALYLDANGVIYDFFNGQEDLNNKIIRMIGDPYVRLKEDPLRILRALRFKLILGFTFEETLDQALHVSAPLVKLLTPAKVEVEIKKMRAYDNLATNLLLEQYQILTTK